MLYNILGVLMALSFIFAVVIEVIIGYKLLSMESKSEPQKVKIVAPRKSLFRRKEDKKKEQEIKRMETLMANIDAYDGTSSGQKDLD